MSPPQTPVNAAGRRVLVVDDSPRARATLAALLGAVGFTCTEAADGGEAFDLYLRHSHDLVVTDLEMPKVDGFELMAALGLVPAWRRPPVIVVSAAVDAAQRSRPGDLRLAAALLPKPIEARSLLAAVAGVLSDRPGRRPEEA
jgi:CheY-like chemotaxis protein